MGTFLYVDLYVNVMRALISFKVYSVNFYKKKLIILTDSLKRNHAHALCV